MGAGVGLLDKDLALYGLNPDDFECLNGTYFVPTPSDAWSVIKGGVRWKWKSEDGRTMISRRVDVPGYKGFMVYVDGTHVSTYRKYADALAAVSSPASES